MGGEAADHALQRGRVLWAAQQVGEVVASCIDFRLGRVASRSFAPVWLATIDGRRAASTSGLLRPSIQEKSSTGTAGSGL